MSASKRRCGTCRYFQDAGMAGNGWCTHPKRQVSSDVRILVRRAELACRNSWGKDDWEDANASAPLRPEGITVVPSAEAPLTAQASFEDEVTSVVNADPDEQRHEEPGDRVVEHTSLLPDEMSTARRRPLARTRPDDLNEPAHRDQEDRLETIARGGSRSAILRARERHRLRRTRTEEDSLPGDFRDDTSARAAGSQDPFPPDDYVEEEAPATAAAPEADEPRDVVLDEGTVAPTPRSRRLRRRHNPERAPLTDAVPRAEMSPDAAKLTSRDDETRFDSVPEIKADVELPRLRRHVPEARQAGNVSSPESGEDRPEPVNPFDEVLKRAQTIKAAARAEREARQQQARRPIVPPLANEPVADPEPVADAPVRDDTVDEPIDAHVPEAVPQALAEDSATATTEPDPQPVMPQVDRDWLTSRGIRFQRQRPMEEPDDVDDPSFYDEAGEEDYAQAYPEPEARRSWWRGIFRGRGQPEATSPAYTEAYDDWDDQAYGAYEDEYVLSGDQDESEQYVAWDESEYEGDAHPAFEPVGDSDSQIAFSTSMEAFEEDLHSFTERPQHALPWESHDTPEASDAYAPPVPAYEPLDLADEQGLTAFRSRLFNAPQADPVDESRLVSAAREPLVMPRRRPQPAEWTPREDSVAPIAPDALLEDPRDAFYEPEPAPSFDVRTLVAQQGELLDMTIEVAPDIPRQCATCRSYRASEHGERGWCTNNWAFTHRQMVNADDLACESTIGCWWLPADEEIWLNDDESQRDRSTPRVDRLVAHLDPLRRVAGR